MSTTAQKLAELREKLEIAKEPAGELAIAKRAKKGIPSARERIDMLLDRGSFVEIGALMKTPGRDDAMYGDAVVVGHGTVDGRPVAVFSHDQTVFGGSVGEMFGRKVAAVLDFASRSVAPSSVSTTPVVPACRTPSPRLPGTARSASVTSRCRACARRSR